LERDFDKLFRSDAVRFDLDGESLGTIKTVAEPAEIF
jgi:hypothetical protein